MSVLNHRGNTVNASLLLNRWRHWLCAGAGLVLGVTAWANTVEVSTATTLRAGPALDAKILSQLEPGAQVEHLSTQGGWLKVRINKREGWVRITHVKLAVASSTASSQTNPLTGVAGLFTANSNRPTATTGTRGLTPEQLAQAQPAPAEVQLLEHYAATPAQAQQFARSGKLQAHSFATPKGDAP